MKHRPWFQRLTPLVTFGATFLYAGQPINCLAQPVTDLSATSSKDGKDAGLRELRQALPQYNADVSLIPDTVRGAFILKAGSKFPVAILQDIDTNKLESGKPVEALLSTNLDFGGVQLAPAGSKVTGWVTTALAQRRSIEAKFKTQNWLNSSAALTIHFEQIQTGKNGERIRISARPAPQSTVLSSDKDLPLRVSKSGLIILPFDSLHHTATSLAIEGVSMVTGPFKIVAGPVISSIVAAAEPAYGLDHPVANPTAAVRGKAAAIGALKGLPGGFLITGVANRGLDFKIPAGTEIVVELESDLIVSAENSKFAAK